MCGHGLAVDIERNNRDKKLGETSTKCDRCAGDCEEGEGSVTLI